MYGRHLVCMVDIQYVWYASSLYGRHLVCMVCIYSLYGEHLSCTYSKYPVCFVDLVLYGRQTFMYVAMATKLPA